MTLKRLSFRVNDVNPQQPTIHLNMLALLKLIRLKEWLKNLFLFIPTFFAGGLFNLKDLWQLSIGAFSFSLVASGVYILNDYKDREIDRHHPRKKLRPLASGQVKESMALIVMVLFVIIGLSLSFFLSQLFFYLLLLYFSINILYSNGLKNIPILDLFIVASGFMIRIYSGGAIAGVPISHWLAIMIFLLALFLIIAKRRDDILIHSETSDIVRKSSKAYNLEFINSCLTLLSAVIIVAYIMYTLTPEVIQRFETDYLFSTTIFVIAGVMRYLQITFVEQDSGSPTNVLFKDRFILITILGWIISFYLIIYTL